MNPSRFRVIGAESQTEPIPVTTVIEPLKAAEPEPEVLEIPVPQIQVKVLGSYTIPIANATFVASSSPMSDFWLPNHNQPQWVNTPAIPIDVEAEAADDDRDALEKYSKLFGDWVDRETKPSCESLSVETDTGQTNAKSSAFSTTSTKSILQRLSLKVKRPVRIPSLGVLRVKWASKWKAILHNGDATAAPPDLSAIRK